MDFVDLDTEAQQVVLEFLDVEDLCSLACTCTYFNQLITQSIPSAKLWSSRLKDLIGPGLVALHSASVPSWSLKYPHVWRHWYKYALEPNMVRWWKKGCKKMQKNVEQDFVEDMALKAERRSSALAAARNHLNDEGLLDDLMTQSRQLDDVGIHGSGGVSMKSLMARSGHTATMLGTLVVVAGGILRDNSSAMDVMIINLATLKVRRPEVLGNPPATRFRHTCVAIPHVVPGSRLHQQLVAAGIEPEHGNLLAIYGGWNSLGEEFGGDRLEVLQVTGCGSRVRWASLITDGEAPGVRFNHTADIINNDEEMIVVGGDGSGVAEDVVLAEEGGHSAGGGLWVYVLDLGALSWKRIMTCGVDPSQAPVAQALHLSVTRTCPETGAEELVVVGGSGKEGILDMVPRVLNLTSWRWRKVTSPTLWATPQRPVNSMAMAGDETSSTWPTIPPRGPAAVPEDPMVPFYPPPRQRAASVKISNRWLLVLSGQSLHDTYLGDVQRLHLPTLQWAPTPRVMGRPSSLTRRVAGLTAAGLVAFGGCVPTVLGVMPVYKTDVLLLGPPPPLISASKAVEEAIVPGLHILPDYCYRRNPASTRDGAYGEMGRVLPQAEGLRQLGPPRLGELKRTIASKSQPNVTDLLSKDTWADTGSPVTPSWDLGEGTSQGGPVGVPFDHQGRHHKQERGRRKSMLVAESHSSSSMWPGMEDRTPLLRPIVAPSEGLPYVWTYQGGDSLLRPDRWHLCARHKKVLPVGFSVADVQLKVWRDRSNGQLYSVEPPAACEAAEYSNSESDGGLEGACKDDDAPDAWYTLSGFHSVHVRRISPNRMAPYQQPSGTDGLRRRRADMRREEPTGNGPPSHPGQSDPQGSDSHMYHWRPYYDHHSPDSEPQGGQQSGGPSTSAEISTPVQTNSTNTGPPDAPPRETWEANASPSVSHGPSPMASPASFVPRYAPQGRVDHVVFLLAMTFCSLSMMMVLFLVMVLKLWKSQGHAGGATS